MISEKISCHSAFFTDTQKSPGRRASVWGKAFLFLKMNHADIRKVSVSLRIIQTEADHKRVVNPV